MQKNSPTSISSVSEEASTDDTTPDTAGTNLAGPVADPGSTPSIGLNTEDIIQDTKFLITQIDAQNITQNSAEIEWALSDYGTGQIQYSEDLSFTLSTSKELSFEYKNHLQTIKNLKENTTYFYRIISINEKGQQIISQNQSFKTLKNGSTDSSLMTQEPSQVVQSMSPQAAFNTYPTTFTGLPTSKEKALNPPAVGQTIKGDIEGTTIRAVSNPGERHQYSRRQAWNSDESVMYIGEKAYRASDLGFIRDLRTMMSTEWYPSHIDPDVIYGTSGRRFLKGYVSSGKTELVVDVGEGILLGEFEGGISADDRYALVDSGKRRLRVIDIQGKKVHSGPYTIPGNINGGDISQDGKYISWTSGGVTYFSDINFKKVIKTSFSTPHADLCVDINGDQVLVMFTSSVQLTLLRLKDGLVHKKEIFNTGNGHVSCTNFKRPGWTYMSTHRGGQRAVAIKLDYFSYATYEDWGFTRHYLADYNNYNYDSLPKLSASPSGTQVIFTSEWNKKTKFRDFVIQFKQ